MAFATDKTTSTQRSLRSQRLAIKAIKAAAKRSAASTLRNTLPFNTDARFNQRLAALMRDPQFILDNSTWLELTAAAKELTAPNPNTEASCRYLDADIMANGAGTAVYMICYLLASSYGQAVAVSMFQTTKLKHQQSGSVNANKALDLALSVVLHENKDNQKCKTIQSATIEHQLNAAQVKAWLKTMVGSKVSNHLRKQKDRVLNNVSILDLVSFEDCEQDEFTASWRPAWSTEDNIQLEYLHELMRRGIDDLRHTSPEVLTLIDDFFSEEGQQLLKATDSHRTTLKSQLKHLNEHFARGYKPREITKISNTISDYFQMLLRLSVYKIDGKRLQIKHKDTRAMVKRSLRNYDSAPCEMMDYSSTEVVSPYLDNEDVDLMFDAASTGGFLTETATN